MLTTSKRFAAIIVGIDGWEQYTLPLVKSIAKHEPDCVITVVDNESNPPYSPSYPIVEGNQHYAVAPTKRLCYSAAINYGARYLHRDWYIILSNDVLCTGPFAHILEQYTDGDLVGPCLKQVHGFDYLEGWCVCVPRESWRPWDERFLGSDYEDVAYSTAARQRGLGLTYDSSLPFRHLDQRQRFHIIEDFAGKNAHNRELFLREYAKVAA